MIKFLVSRSELGGLFMAGVILGVGLMIAQAAFIAEPTPPPITADDWCEWAIQQALGGEVRYDGQKGMPTDSGRNSGLSASGADSASGIGQVRGKPEA